MFHSRSELKEVEIVTRFNDTQHTGIAYRMAFATLHSIEHRATHRAGETKTLVTEGASLPANLSGHRYRVVGPLWKADSTLSRRR